MRINTFYNVTNDYTQGFVTHNSNLFTKSSEKQFEELNKTKPYIPYSGCVLEHILHSLDLTNNEKLFYLIADSLSLINGKNTMKKRSVALPATKWAEKLNCSKNEIFTMQKSLEAKGYFIVVRDKNEFGKNQRNLITPSLPDTVFHYLSKAPDRLNHELRNDFPVTSLTSSLAFSHCLNIEKNKRVYLDKTKLFIRLNYQLLLLIASSDQLTSFAKVLWLDFYTKCYKYHMKLKNTDTGGDNNDFACTTSYKELETKYSCTKTTLSKTMNVLDKLGFIDKKRFHVKNDNKDDNLHDKSLWNITLSLPKELAQDIINLKPRANSLLKYDYQANSKLNISSTDPYVANFGQLLNKDSELNNNNLLLNFKDSDSIDKKNNFFENFNQTPVPSELSVSYKNSFSFKEKSNSNIKSQTTDLKILNNKDITKTIFLEKYKKQDREVATTSSDISIPVELSNHIDTQKITTIQPSSINDSEITKTNNKALTQPKSSNQGKTLKAFYPLTKEQVDELNYLSGRQFSVNFTNQLLLKLSHDPNKLFLSKNHMMSYMSKALRYEKHQAPLVNHESFRLIANILDTESVDERQIEKCLSEVEYSLDTSYLSQIRKKIVSTLGTSERKLAYRLLTEVEYKFEYQGVEEPQNQQYLPIHQQVQQQNRKQEQISQELNEFKKLLSDTSTTEYTCTIQLPKDLVLTYLQEEILEKAITSVYGNDIDINYEKIVTKNWGINKKSQINSLSEINLENLNPNSGWYKIRKKVKTMHNGEFVDKAWFSKLTAEEDKTNNTLKLYAPSNFIRDYVNNNYTSIVRQIAKEFGYQVVELVAKKQFSLNVA